MITYIYYINTAGEIRRMEIIQITGNHFNYIIWNLTTEEACEEGRFTRKELSAFFHSITITRVYS